MTRRKTTSPDPVRKYAKDVVAGRIVAGPHVRASCQRHLDDLKDGKKRGLRWSQEHADRALKFFPTVLRLSEGQFDGIPFELHPSQAFIIGSLFGWLRSDGTRRFRRAYIEQGKGNGKSPLVAGIGLYGLVADNEPGAQIYAAAAKMDQARIMFNDAVAMTAQSEPLQQHITQTGFNPVNNLSYQAKRSFFKPLGRDTGKTGSGLRPHFALVDELHEHPNRDTLDMLEQGFKFRRQPLLCMITNSGVDRNSVCFEEHEHAVSVAHRRVEDDATFSYVCALDEKDDPLNDPSCWPKANPLLGVTLTHDYLADQAAIAKAIPGKANVIKRLHFCMWTDTVSAWIGHDAWTALEDETLDISDFEGRECFIGLDLGMTFDLTGKAYIFPDGETDDGRPKYVLFADGYTPADTLRDREKADRAPYGIWVERGDIRTSPGSQVRLDLVAHDLALDAQRFNIVQVAYDRWLIRELDRYLDDEGVALPLVEHPQSINRRQSSVLWMPDSINKFEALVLEGRLRIGVNYALRSAVSSAMVWTSPSGLRRIEKQKVKGRVDLCVASVMAAGAACALEEEAQGGSYLESAELVIL